MVARSRAPRIGWQTLYIYNSNNYIEYFSAIATASIFFMSYPLHTPPTKIFNTKVLTHNYRVCYSISASREIQGVGVPPLCSLKTK